MHQRSDSVKGVNFGVNKELITMFLKMTPEERLRPSDNTVGAIMELKNALKQRKTSTLELRALLKGLNEAGIEFIPVGGGWLPSPKVLQLFILILISFIDRLKKIQRCC